MLKDFLDWCVGLTLKDVLQPLTGMVVGVLSYHGVKSQMRHSDRERAAIAQSTADAAHLAADAATADSITRRFSVLMDSYEHRIADLTEEVQNLRSEVRQNRDEIAKLRQELAHARTRPERPAS